MAKVEAGVKGNNIVVHQAIRETKTLVSGACIEMLMF